MRRARSAGILEAGRCAHLVSCHDALGAFGVRLSAARRRHRLHADDVAPPGPRAGRWRSPLCGLGHRRPRCRQHHGHAAVVVAAHEQAAGAVLEVELRRRVRIAGRQLRPRPLAQHRLQRGVRGVNCITSLRRHGGGWPIRVWADSMGLTSAAAQQQQRHCAGPCYSRAREA